MKAPDKIYVEIRHPMSTEYTEIIGFDTTEKNTIEYIRKDALLEWAKEQKEKLGSSDSFTTQGKLKMLERLIDKIESM